MARTTKRLVNYLLALELDPWDENALARAQALDEDYAPNETKDRSRFRSHGTSGCFAVAS